MIVREFHLKILLTKNLHDGTNLAHPKVVCRLRFQQRHNIEQFNFLVHVSEGIRPQKYKFSTSAPSLPRFVLNLPGANPKHPKTRLIQETDNYADYEAYGAAGFVKVVFQEESGGYLVIHPEHGQNEWEENKRIGRILAELGDAVILLPNNAERRSPDALRNREEWEFKTIRASNLKNAVQNALRKGKTQSKNIICFINMLYTIENITLGIFNAVKFDREARIEKIGILFPDGRLIEMTRAEVWKGLFVRKFY